MRRRIEAEFALFRLQARLAAADLGVAGELAGEQEMRIVELEQHGGLVDLADPSLLALGGKFRRRRFDEILVLVHVLVPEHEVVGRERRAIGPFHALAQEQCGAAAVGTGLPALRHPGRDLRAVDVPEQQLVGGAHAVAVLAVAGPEEAAPPGAAVFADAAQRLDHHRLLRHALLDRRQLAGLDEFGQRRRLAEFLRPLRRVGDDGRVFQFSDQAGLRQIRLLRECRAGEQHCQGNQDRSHGVSLFVVQATPRSDSSAAAMACAPMRGCNFSQNRQLDAAAIHARKDSADGTRSRAADWPDRRFRPWAR